MHESCLRQYAASMWFEVKPAARKSPRKQTVQCPICRVATKERAEGGDDEMALADLADAPRKRPRDV